MTAEKMLALARAELGEKEKPAGSNCVKYNTVYYGRTVCGSEYPWCCVFLWWLFQKAGVPQLFYGGKKTASCGTLALWAKSNGRFVSSGYRAGDVVFFHFDGSKIQHVGLVESAREDGTLITIEGNTGAGNDANGGQVQRRTRSVRVTAGAYRPNYQEEDSMTQQQFDTMMDNYLTRRAAAEPSDFSAQARSWAEKSGIVRGGSDGKMNYKSYCTREQMAVFLFRLAKQLSGQE